MFGNHSGVALTNASFKNLSEHFGFRSHQDHYKAYVEHIEIVWIHIEGEEMAKCVRFSENPTKSVLVA